jgi:DNA-binding MarR family transcriptional regulator
VDKLLSASSYFIASAKNFIANDFPRSSALGRRQQIIASCKGQFYTARAAIGRPGSVNIRVAVSVRDGALESNLYLFFLFGAVGAGGPLIANGVKRVNKIATMQNIVDPVRARREAGAAVSNVNLGDLDGYIAFHLRMAQEASLRAFIARSSQPDFKPGRFATLMVVKLNPGISQIEVCRAIGRDKSTVSPLIRELEDEGLIAREASTADRRSVTLRLTEKGEDSLDVLTKHAENHDRRLDDVVGDAKPEFVAILKKIAAALN